jgi:hypothetical protein
MLSYIVIFETKTKADEFAIYLKSLSSWGRLTDDSWLVVTSKSASQIRDDLDARKAVGDRIFVIKSGYVAAWANTRADNEWIKKHL